MNEQTNPPTETMQEMIDGYRQEIAKVAAKWEQDKPEKVASATLADGVADEITKSVVGWAESPLCKFFQILAVAWFGASLFCASLVPFLAVWWLWGQLMPGGSTWP